MASGDGATSAGMELTSYGAGTHGYLPPECYEGDSSRICPKVEFGTRFRIFNDLHVLSSSHARPRAR
eukprot:2704651-Pleurochrysis_carterae.AAC.1